MNGIYNDEIFSKLDNLCWITKPDYFNKIHKVIGNSDSFLTIHSKNWNDFWYSKDHFVSAKEAFYLVKNGIYRLRYSEGVETASKVKVMWAIKEACGLPYLKHWIELVEVFYKSEKPLLCKTCPTIKIEGKEIDQALHYDIANAVLGLIPDEQLLKDNGIIDEKNNLFNSAKAVKEYYGRFSN
ncbi:MAG: hypothetical protein MJZ50_03815 [Treponema sp.]|nr:hypothetical protein [Treponema sp.]